MLAPSVTLQRFQMVSRRTSHIIQYRGAIQLAQFSLGNPFNGAELGRALPLVEMLSVLAPKSLDHAVKI
jgi:hypothetical protein